MKITPRLVAGGGVGGGVVASILALIFATEGGLVNHPDDPGGTTNHGITERTARQAGYTGPMATLPKETAEIILRTNYVVEASPLVAHKLIDIGVIAGQPRASKWFQEALNSYNRRSADYRNITADGVIGPATMRAFEALEKRRGSIKTCELMVKALDARVCAHFLSLSINDSQYESFTIGWMDNRCGNVDWRQCSKGF